MAHGASFLPPAPPRQVSSHLGLQGTGSPSLTARQVLHERGWKPGLSTHLPASPQPLPGAGS